MKTVVISKSDRPNKKLPDRAPKPTTLLARDHFNRNAK